MIHRFRLSRTLFAVPSMLLLALLSLACHSPPSTSQADSADPAASPIVSEPQDPPPAEVDQKPVSYEPAYPAEVSADGLDADDAAQQEQAHSHGGDEHSHGEGAHEHGGDGDEHGH